MTAFTAFPNIKKNHLLTPYTTFRVGGPADYFYDLTDYKDLPHLIKEAQKEGFPFIVIGAGSNTLFHDAGFRGLVIHMAGTAIQQENTDIIADAGVSMHKVVSAAQKAGLTGLEPFTGLPGTVGGAMRGNAGCFGKEMKDVVTEVTLFSPEKSFFECDAADMQFGYRTSMIKTNPGITVCRARFHLAKADAVVIAAEMAKILGLRKTKQPPGPSAGSWFKNPDGHHAGQLLDAAGCKGLTVGGAVISPYHANFFMNTGTGTAADLIALNKKAKALVQAKFGISLETEVKIVPEWI